MMDTNFVTFLAVMKLEKKSNPFLAVTELGEKVNYFCFRHIGFLPWLDYVHGGIVF